jgi:uncharacterized protein (TIGR03546 family)
MANNNQTTLWRRFCQSVDGKSGSRQLAVGAGLGMMIGLMPKDSLLFVVMTVILILSPANLMSGFCSCIVFSYLSSLNLVQSAMHSIGMAVFKTDLFVAMVGSWYSVPLFPWFDLDNSIAMGALLMGLLLLIPVYLFSLKIFDRFGDQFYSKVRDSVFCRWLVGERKSKLGEGQA